MFRVVIKRKKRTHIVIVTQTLSAIWNCNLIKLLKWDENYVPYATLDISCFYSTNFLAAFQAIIITNVHVIWWGNLRLNLMILWYWNTYYFIVIMKPILFQNSLKESRYVMIFFHIILSCGCRKGAELYEYDFKLSNKKHKMYYGIFMHMCVQLLRLFVVFRCVRRYTIVVKSFWWHFYAPNMNIFFVFIHIIFSFFLIKNSSVFLEYFWRS